MSNYLIRLGCLTDTVSDRAVGLSTLSHTKTVASYEPEVRWYP